VIAYHGSTIIKKFGSWKRVLEKVYPEKDWKSLDKSVLSYLSKSQRLLYNRIRELLPNTIIEESYFHPDLKHASSNKNMQLDIWIPEHKLR
jgi:hypothetical protein